LLCILPPCLFNLPGVPRVDRGNRKFRHDNALENDFAAPAREITSRHEVDKRSLLPLAERGDAECHDPHGTRRSVFILQRRLSSIQSLNRTVREYRQVEVQLPFGRRGRSGSREIAQQGSPLGGTPAYDAVIDGTRDAQSGSTFGIWNSARSSS
jgi:hypothetical protein